MTTDVVLTAAMRSNLLSLQNTQSLIDTTQFRLATGRKVNSALDNPQSFFAAQALNNRASDLSRLLDGMGQSIQVIKAADNGISGLTKMLEQADAVATTALEATSSAAQSAAITGDLDVTDFTATAATAGTLTLNFTDQNGVDVTATGGTITIANGDNINTIINNINAIRNSDNEQIITASLSDSGRLQIKTLNGNNARLELISTGTATLVGSQTLSGQLGLSQLLVAENVTTAGGASTSLAVNIEAASSVSSQALYQADGSTLAQRSTTLQSLLRDANGDGTIADDVFTATAAGGGDTFSINIGINGTTATAISVDATTTIQGLIDSINNNVNIKSRIEASFDETAGRVTIAAKDGSVSSVELNATVTEGGGDGNATIAVNFGFGSSPSNTSDNANASTTSTTVESIRFGAGGGEIAQAQSDFNKLREQINTLIGDSGYRGVNLLNGDNLVTTFNEDRTNQLTTAGVNFTAAGLGVDEAAFATREGITKSLEQARNALGTVRNFGGAIANDLSIIQTRQEFTTSTINVLSEGSDKLTVADQNEEGAKLLALQTRQQLGVTSLALASQSQQAVLRLF